MSGGAATSAGTTARRLRKRADFLAAAQGRRFHTERLTAQGRLREPDETRDGAVADGLHIGFTITTRIGHATERNRIRRRLRRAVELAARTLPPHAADIVVIARRPALDATFDTLVDDLCRAFAVVTKPRGPRSASGGRGREGAHEPHRPSLESTQPASPHGPNDG